MQGLAAEGAARDQVGGEAEHEPARADGDAAGRCGQPRAQPSHHRDDRGDRHDPGEAAEGDRGPEQEERHGVRDQMPEAAVEERRDGDAGEPLRIARPDAGRIEIRRDEVDHLDDPHERSHGGDEEQPAETGIAGGPGRIGRRGMHDPER
jgi:hypothetical protein